MKKIEQTTMQLRETIWILISIFLLGVALFSLFALYYQNGFVKKTCSEMNSYKEAKAAYLAGFKHLDGDNNGVPCELLLKRQ